MDDEREVKIPASLYRAIEEKLKDSHFDSVSDFITYFTRKTITELSQGKVEVTDEEKEAIRRRLKDLGYLE